MPTVDWYSHSLPPDLIALLGPYETLWKRRSEPDYYGASWLISQSIGLKNTPRSFVRWSHGVTAYSPTHLEVLAEKGTKGMLVSNNNVKSFLEKNGVSGVHAVGMPIIYTDSCSVTRRLNSLLIMPMHGLSYTSMVANYQELIEHAKEARKSGMFVCFCVYKDGLETERDYLRALNKEGIPWFAGASSWDPYSLQRLRNIFSFFEFVTSDGYGSHLWYSQLFGAKFYFATCFSGIRVENFKNDPYWNKYPSALEEVLYNTGEETLRSRYPDYFRGRSNAICDATLSMQLCGYSFKRKPEEVATLLGWDASGRIKGYGGHFIKKVSQRLRRHLQGTV